MCSSKRLQVVYIRILGRLRVYHDDSHRVTQVLPAAGEGLQSPSPFRKDRQSQGGSSLMVMGVPCRPLD